MTVLLKSRYIPARWMAGQLDADLESGFNSALFGAESF
jgi:hypothetical protein